jgi:hypothetical protein
VVRQSIIAAGVYGRAKLLTPGRKRRRRKRRRKRRTERERKREEGAGYKLGHTTPVTHFP